MHTRSEAYGVSFEGDSRKNAQLIAAAPELLTVLQTIEKAFVESCGDFHFADYEHLILQAIAKAEGREGK